MEADELETKLISYISEMNIAKMTLSQIKGINIDCMDIQLALYDVLDIQGEQLTDLLSKNISSGEMIKLLRNYNFTMTKIIEEIELDESILPVGTPKLLIEQTIKSKGEVWRIHQNDADPFPSTPHAHHCDSGISLHLGTGELFEKRKSKGFLECKNLKKIRDKIKVQDQLPPLDHRCS